MKSIGNHPSPPGFYATLYYDGTDFILFTNAGKDYAATTTSNVFTTTGTLQMVSEYSKAYSVVAGEASSVKIPNYHSKTLFLASDGTTYPSYDGQIDCETNPAGSNGALSCLNKEDLVVIHTLLLPLMGLPVLRKQLELNITLAI